MISAKYEPCKPLLSMLDLGHLDSSRCEWYRRPFIRLVDQRCRNWQAWPESIRRSDQCQCCTNLQSLSKEGTYCRRFRCWLCHLGSARNKAHLRFDASSSMRLQYLRRFILSWNTVGDHRRRQNCLWRRSSKFFCTASLPMIFISRLWNSIAPHCSRLRSFSWNGRFQPIRLPKAEQTRTTSWTGLTTQLPLLNDHAYFNVALLATHNAEDWTWTLHRWSDCNRESRCQWRSENQC